MTPQEALLLALVQGITEFLPISSSAHLILLPWFLGWEDHDLTFDVVTNAGTLTAALIYFRHDLTVALRRLRASVTARSGGGSAPWRDRLQGLGARPGLVLALIVATGPVCVVGLLFYDFFATTARHPLVIATTSIVFGLLLFWADQRGRRARQAEELGLIDSLWLGFAQAVALLPGTSRSGITITAGLWRGLKREEAARFSFLMAVPVGLLAFAKDVLDLLNEGADAARLMPLALGFGVSAIAAYLTIGWLLHWLTRQSMTLFVVYRIFLGILILIWVFQT